VGEALLRRDLGERDAEIHGLRTKIAMLQHSQKELCKLQGEHAELLTEVERLRKACVLCRMCSLCIYVHTQREKGWARHRFSQVLCIVSL
jgi:hypothetical protein